ncbi:glycoside hydrolase [Tamlana crocina]
MRYKKTNFVHVFVVVWFAGFIGTAGMAQTLQVQLNTEKEHQTILGFGASDAWRCQFVGSNWPEHKKEKIAEWLFSKETDKKGNPKGIGLSMWRFYIGAGTTEQGSDSNIANEWRRAESFIDVNGNYNWKKQEGQQWFLEKAKHYGVDKLLAFSISAPVQWTKNGKGYNGDNKDGEINLKPEYFDDYANFMVEFLKHFDSQGIFFDYLSPINEPQWDWEKKSQEGTPATNQNILKLTKMLDKGIDESGVSTKIVLGEAADLRWLYSNYNKSERGNQIDFFFNEKKELKHLDNTITGHSYFTTWPVDSLIGIRKKLKHKLNEYPGLDYWQSEFCILEKNDDIGGGHQRDLGINTALYVARVIHADLTLANASSWQWWTALTIANFKDGLIYLDTGNPNDLYNKQSLKHDGEYHDSKLLWALGNYSRFVKPGMVRVEVESNRNKEALKKAYNNMMVSGYLDKDTSEVVLVAINYSDEDQVLNVTNCKIENVNVTSENSNLETFKVDGKVVVLKAKSINTLTGSLKK